MAERALYQGRPLKAVWGKNEHGETVRYLPVVCCEECKWFVQMGDTPISRVCIRTGGLTMAKPDDFCSYGEKKR